MSVLTPVRDHGPAVAGGIDVDLPGDGVRLRATRWPGAGTPVLLLHGLASTRRFWNLVVPDLVAAGLSVVALDQRGHGESPVTDDADFSPTAVARDAGVALDALGISRAVVVGHSWGASISLTLAASQPGRVLAAVAIDGGFAMRPAEVDVAELRERLKPPVWSAPPGDLPRLLGRGPLAPYWDEERARALLPIFGVGEDGQARARLPLAQHMAIVDGMLAEDVAATLKAVRCPAWLVSCEPAGSMAGDLDDWSRQKAEGLALAAAALPDARTMRWSGALHDVPLQWPALVSGLVRDAANHPDDRREETP
ncbi:MAG: non-heme chloroperoxidase [Frankiales bacterium]|jgi:pimeloyl-ACP methyl ester carboxylesterase|nr:non-heme chloroperoxidase [Frankiales bacterium]